MKSTDYIGKPVNRVDGLAKVTGRAKYAAEFTVPGLAYGYIISGSIAKGSIKSIDASAALGLKGVLYVFTHENVAGLAWFDISYKDMTAPPGSPFRQLQSKNILFSQQPVALVVADSFELARYAATLVRIEYEAETPVTDLNKNLQDARPIKNKRIGFHQPQSRGNFQQAFSEADVKLEAAYIHGAEHHNPMEMHASTVVYNDDGSITVYDKTQSVLNSQHYISMIFGLSKSKVRVLSQYVGGAFGSGLRPQYQLFMAVLAALKLKRSVKVSLTRQQMFSFGHRPVTVQQLALGASPDGSLQAVSHAAVAETSRFENYMENLVNWSGSLYRCKNVSLDHKLVQLDMYTPIDMRAPGAATGVHALECAMDELSCKLGMDPLELRIKNYAETDQSENKPYSSKELLACYRQGAEKFGWSARDPVPRSMKAGNLLTGMGMATGVWDAMQLPARARAVFTANGKLVVSSATADIGTGTYTIMTQIAAEIMGLSLEDVTFALGDSSFPFALVEGGSATAGSVGTAVQDVCLKIREKLFHLAKKIQGSMLKGTKADSILFSNGYINLTTDPSQAISLTDVMKYSNTQVIERTSIALPHLLQQRKYTRNTHAAVFAEVKVDEALGTIQVSRIVSAIAAGRILNPKTARSQVIGGIVWGISMALHEDSVMDHYFGRFINHNLAEYHVAINADIQKIEVIFVEEHDRAVNPLGVKGVGEIGIVGVAAAIANAVYHATGRRIRSLPVMLDKLL